MLTIWQEAKRDDAEDVGLDTSQLAISSMLVHRHKGPIGWLNTWSDLSWRDAVMVVFKDAMDREGEFYRKSCSQGGNIEDFPQGQLIVGCAILCVKAKGLVS